MRPSRGCTAWVVVSAGYEVFTVGLAHLDCALSAIALGRVGYPVALLLVSVCTGLPAAAR